MISTSDYILGTHDEEIERLGLQHRAWRERALDAWRAAGIGAGQTVLDVGCGPGYAALDLAELAGTSGRIVAIDKSERFLQVLEAACQERRLGNLRTFRADLDAGEFPSVIADRAWCRWVLAFVKNPREVLARIAGALTPDGVIVLHEYFDYATWRGAPQCSELEEFVSAVMTNGATMEVSLISRCRCLVGWRNLASKSALPGLSSMLSNPRTCAGGGLRPLSKSGASAWSI